MKKGFVMFLSSTFLRSENCVVARGCSTKILDYLAKSGCSGSSAILVKCVFTISKIKLYTVGKHKTSKSS